MKLVLLGTGGYFPTPKRQTACLVLPEVGVVLDAGTGMYRLRDYVQTKELNIFLSHAHLDHIAGLTYLLNVVPHDVLKRVTVHGEAEKLAAVREHLFAELIFPIAPVFAFESLKDQCPLPAGGQLTHFPLQHPGGTIGFRLDWPGHSMAYVTDTTARAEADYVDKIRGVELLVHEAYFADDADNLPAITGHSWLEQVAEVAAAAKVAHLVLVHIDPQIEDDRAYDLSAARQIFKSIRLGVDQMEVEF